MNDQFLKIDARVHLADIEFYESSFETSESDPIL